jgi:hypothetical protein
MTMTSYLVVPMPMRIGSHEAQYLLQEFRRERAQTSLW